MTSAAQKIRIGGLMRCCILTISKDAPENPQEGEKLQCRWCSLGKMIFKSGAWEWDKPPEPKGVNNA